MSFFQCEVCGAKENTALTNGYWYREELPKRCSECSSGKWHGEFPKQMLPMGEFKTNRQGNLEHIKTGDTDLSKYVILS